MEKGKNFLMRLLKKIRLRQHAQNFDPLGGELNDVTLLLRFGLQCILVRI